MGEEKYITEREQTETVEWKDLSGNGENAEGGSPVPEPLSNGQRSEDLATNSNRLKHSFEELSESLMELSQAMEETIR